MLLILLVTHCDIAILKMKTLCYRKNSTTQTYWEITMVVIHHQEERNQMRVEKSYTTRILSSQLPGVGDSTDCVRVLLLRQNPL